MSETQPEIQPEITSETLDRPLREFIAELYDAVGDATVAHMLYGPQTLTGRSMAQAIREGSVMGTDWANLVAKSMRRMILKSLPTKRQP